MSANDSENIKKQTFDRILTTIDLRKRRKRLLGGLGLFLIFFLFCGSLAFFHMRSVDVSSSTGKHLYADITAGEITISGAKTETIKEWKNSVEKPFKISRKDKMLVIEQTGTALSELDDVVLRVGVGGFYKVLLRDGTTVYLNSNSELSYKGDFLKNRILKLKGEGYFEVSQREQSGKKQAFIVLTEKQHISVLGTKFNVLSRDKMEQTVLTEGSIDLRSIGQDRSELLRPGDRAVLDDTGMIDRTKVSTDDYTSWKDGNLYYENRSLSYILRDLSNIYPIHFDPNTVPRKNFTLFLKRDRPFSEILDLIKKSGNINIRLEDHEVIF